MEMFPIDSDGVRAVGYDPSTHALHVELETGSLYEFMEVPEATYNAFLAAPAKEAYVERVLRPGYRFVELT